MRRKNVLAALAVAVALLLPGSALPAAGGTDLPIKASHSGYGTADLTTLPVIQTHLVTSGVVSHLGLSTLVQDLVVVFSGPTSFTSTGTWTITAANGDQIFGTVTGSGVFTDAVHSTTVATYTSSGGTGRFAEATTTFTAIVHGTRVSVVGGVGTTYYEGTSGGQLSYH